MNLRMQSTIRPRLAKGVVAEETLRASRVPAIAVVAIETDDGMQSPRLTTDVCTLIRA